MNKLKVIIKYKKENNIRCPSLIVYLRYLKARFKYKIGLEMFLNNQLFDYKIDHSDFYSKLHTYIHRWENCSKKYVKSHSGIWLLLHHVQYLFFKIIYPGLDAMDYFRYEFYRLKNYQRREFITEGFLRKLNGHFNKRKGNEVSYEVLDNKMLFNKFFHDLICRDWIYIDNNFDEIMAFCRKNSVIFVKPANGGGGSGIAKKIVHNDNDSKLLFEKYNNKQYLIEEAIKQHEKMNELNSSSVNTIRIYSVVFNDNVHIVGATLRFGNGLSNVDNYSSGNYAASVDEKTGIVDSTAINQDGERISIHPISKCEILGFQIPNWEEVIELAKQAHNRIKNLRYIGWDIAIDAKGKPILIEGNTYAGVELQQHPKLVGVKSKYKKYW